MDAAKRGKRNRQRGQEGEREIANFLTDSLGIPVKRLLGQERDKGADILTKPYRWEIKRRKRIALIYEWIKEAEDSCTGNEKPVVAFRADGKKWMVVLPVENFVELIREEISHAANNEMDRG